MSATGRGSERQPFDFYETPSWCVERIKPFLANWQGSPVLEPSVGRGAIAKHFSKELVTGIDLDPERTKQAASFCSSVYTMNALDFLSSMKEIESEWDGLIITNPPYSKAHAFVTSCLDILSPNGCLCMLLPIHYVGSQRRASFFQERFTHMFILSERPSFTGDGKTDASNYVWFTWHKGLTSNGFTVIS